MKQRPLIIDDPRFDEHGPSGSSAGHPERPERLAAARAGLWRAIPEGQACRIVAAPATPVDVHRVHDAHYLHDLDMALARGTGQLDPDTYFSQGTREAMWIASGGVVEMTRGFVAAEATTGFALVRPPGHHALAARAMGFCLLNHVAVAAASALAAGAERVAIVDWDVHHGNGTQAIFEDDPRVLFVSLHQWPLFPGTGRFDEIGRGSGRGFTANVALPPRAGDAIYGEAFRRLVLPLLDAFAPTLVLVSAGFDAHARDPLGGAELTSATFGAMASALLARDAPVGFVLEGGYDLIGLEESVAEVGRAMLGARVTLPEGGARVAEREALEDTLRVLTPFWPSLALAERG